MAKPFSQAHGLASGHPPADAMLDGPMTCSFCGRNEDEVGRLVRAGTTDIAICEACARLCLDIFEELLR
ncbi:MAG TPA: ClpX C4-type zinc finger protein [Gaiellaceae bacterium]